MTKFHQAKSHQHRTRPRRWARGGADGGSAGADIDRNVTGKEAQRAAALIDTTLHHAAAASSSSASAAAVSVHPSLPSLSPSPPPTADYSSSSSVSSLFTDFWHLESGVAVWRSAAQRSRTLLASLEQHLRHSNVAADSEVSVSVNSTHSATVTDPALKAAQVAALAEAAARREKRKKERQMRKERRRRERARRRAKRQEEAEKAATFKRLHPDAIDLTEESPPVARPPPRTQIDVSDESSSEDEDEFDVESFLSAAKRFSDVTTGHGHAAPAHTGASEGGVSVSSPEKRGRSKRGRVRRIVDEDEDEEEEKKEYEREEQPMQSKSKGKKIKPAPTSVSSSAGMSPNTGTAASSSSPRSTASAAPADLASMLGLSGDRDEMLSDDDLSTLGPTLRRIIESRRAAARRQEREKAKREAKAAGKGKGRGLKRQRSQQGRRRVIIDDEEEEIEYDDALPSFSPPPSKRRRQTKTHRVVTWVDEKPPKGRGKAASAASSTIATHSHAYLPIEQRLAADPSSFLCLGYLNIRPGGPVNHHLLPSSSHNHGCHLRAVFSQKLQDGSVTNLDPSEPILCHFRLHDPMGEAKREEEERQEQARKNREAARKRRMQQEMEDANDMIDEPIIDRPSPPQDNDPNHDLLAVAPPIIWHPSAIIDTHRAQPIHLQQPPSQPATSSATSAASSESGRTASSSPISSPSVISMSVLSSIHFLYSRRSLFIHPVYSVRHDCFKLWIYLTPQTYRNEYARSLHNGLLNGVSAAHAHGADQRMENEAMCENMERVVRWGCGEDETLRSRILCAPTAFNPSRLFESCRPPAVNPDLPPSLYPAAHALSARLRSLGLLPTLRPYQLQALCWMIRREREPWLCVKAKKFHLSHVHYKQLEAKGYVCAEDERSHRGIQPNGERASEMIEERKDGEVDEIRAIARSPSPSPSPSPPPVDASVEERAIARLRSELMPIWQSFHPPQLHNPFMASSSVVKDAQLPPRLWSNEFTGSLLGAESPMVAEEVEEARGGILAEEMGLGKTVISISAVMFSPRAACTYAQSTIMPTDISQSVIPLLPRTRLPGEKEKDGAMPLLLPSPPSSPTDGALNGRGSDGGSNLDVVTQPLATRPARRRAPPLLLDPLLMSKRALESYQKQLANRFNPSKFEQAIRNLTEDGENEDEEVQEIAKQDLASRLSSSAAAAIAIEESGVNEMSDDEGEQEYLAAPSSTAAVGSARASARTPPRPPSPPKRIACFCGIDSPYITSASDRLVQCDLCHSYQHAACMRKDPDRDEGVDSIFSPTPPFPYSYLCPGCSSRSSTPILPIGATLIVCPDTILAQWAEEIWRHVNRGFTAKDRKDRNDTGKAATARPLKVLIYKGVRSNMGMGMDGGSSNATDQLTFPRLDNELERRLAGDMVDVDDVAKSEPTAADLATEESWKPRYSVFVATEDFVRIRVERPKGMMMMDESTSSMRSKKQRKGKSRSRNTTNEMAADGEPVNDSAASSLPFSIVRPAQFAAYDVVLTTYTVLRNDLYHTMNESVANRSARFEKKYPPLPTPLTGCNWWRVILDEAQMVGEGSARCAEMALKLSAVHRWSVTGTPIYRSLDDLYGLSLFLGAVPYANKAYWRRVISAPYDAGHRAAVQRLHAFLSRVCWRNTKRSVAAQLHLPPTRSLIHRIDFTPVEQYLYERRRDECRSVSSTLRQFGRSALSTPALKKVLHALLRLRQACVHPQVGAATGLVSLSKHTLTLRELTVSMMKDARLNCEEIQRRQYFALHGLAAIAIIKREYQAAVELYEYVVGVDEQEMTQAWKRRQDAKRKQSMDNADDDEKGPNPTPSPSPSRRAIAIDDLQKIHAMHNLADVLALLHGLKLDDIKPATDDEEEHQQRGVARAKNEAEAEEQTDGVTDMDIDDTSSVGMLPAAAANSPASTPAEPETSSSSGSQSVAVSAPASAPSPLVPATALTRIRLLRRFVADLQHTYLFKQAQAVADAQRKFNQLNEQIFAALHPRTISAQRRVAASSVAASSSSSTAVGVSPTPTPLEEVDQNWWMGALAMLHAAPSLEERFIATLRRELFLSSESLIQGEKAQPSIAESFRQATGFRFVMMQLLDEMNKLRETASKKVAMLARNQPPTQAEINASAHCARCRAPYQTGVPCADCRATQSLNEYEKKLYRFRLQTKQSYIRNAGTGKDAAANRALILPGEGRSRRELATMQLITQSAKRRAREEAKQTGQEEAAAAMMEEEWENEESKVSNFQMESEAEKSLKILMKFMQDNRAEIEIYQRVTGAAAAAAGSATAAARADIDYLMACARDHISLLDLYKKELKLMQSLTAAHRDQLSLYDELSMSTLRIRLRLEGEEVPPAERHFKLEPWQVEESVMRYEHEFMASKADMAEWKGRLNFLEAQVQQSIQRETEQKAAGRGGAGGSGSASTLCGVCHDTDLAAATQIAVLPCAHQFCVSCINHMLGRAMEVDPDRPWEAVNRARVIKCPTCRLRAAKREIAFVATVPTSKKEGTKGRMLGGSGVDARLAAADAAERQRATIKLEPVDEQASSSPAPSSAAASASSSAASSSSATATPPQISVQGSWSSKITSILQCILQLTRADSTNKLLVFSEWLEVLTILQQALRANGVRFLQIGGGGAKGKGGGGGGGGKKKFAETLAIFKSNPLIPVLLLPLKTAASGLNIVEANHVLLVEPSLSAGKEAQAIGRVVRIGQTRPTCVHRFLVRRSVEEKIYALHSAQRHKDHDHATEGDEHDEADMEDDELWTPSLGQKDRSEEQLDARTFATLLGQEGEEIETAEEGEGGAEATPADEGEVDEEKAEAKEESDLREAIARSQVDTHIWQQPASRQQQPDTSGVASTATSASSIPASLSGPLDEHAFLSTLQSEHAALSEQHRYWTHEKVVLEGGKRTVNRLLALILLQRQHKFQSSTSSSASSVAAAVTAVGMGKEPEEADTVTLVEWHGKMISPTIRDALHQLPLAPTTRPTPSPAPSAASAASASASASPSPNPSTMTSARR